MGHPRTRRLPLLIVVFGLVCLSAASAEALAVRVSGRSPYAGCDVRIGRRETTYVNAEVEPWVAVDPSDSRHLVGVWQQDRHSFGGANGLAAATSWDRGRTWQETTLPFDQCAPGGQDFERASDPWVSIGPDGTVYAISVSFNFFANFDNAILASTSDDGGETWNDPVVVHSLVGAAAQEFSDDKESITADPVRPGYAYAVWDVFGTSAGDDAVHGRIDGPDATDGGARRNTAPVWFSRTTDGGVSWSDPRPIYEPGPGNTTIASQVVVDPTTGTLYDFFDLERSDSFFQAFIRSTDGGLTWSRPTTIARDFGISVRHPNTGAPLRVGVLPDAAVDPRSGDLYVVWEDARYSDFQHDDIVLSRSVDGGDSWSRPIRVNTLTGLPAFTPSVEVNSRGIVGITYYDLRDVGQATSTLPTDAWLLRLRNGGRTRISETKLAGPFDTLTAPFAGGYFLGDYEGLAASGRRFATFFTVANDGRTHNRTDIVSLLG